MEASGRFQWETENLLTHVLRVCVATKAPFAQWLAPIGENTINSFPFLHFGHRITHLALASCPSLGTQEQVVKPTSHSIPEN